MTKKIPLLIFWLMGSLLYAQVQTKQGFSWGVHIGLETQSLGIISAPEDNVNNPWVEVDRNKAGFAAGFVVRRNIWRGLSFQSGLNYSRTYNLVRFSTVGKQRFEFNDLELPLYLTITKHHNRTPSLSPKLVVGPRLGWNFTQNPNNNLKFLQERMAIDLGIGFEWRLGKWLVSPEMIYSHGLNNIHDFIGTTYDYLTGRSIRDKLAFRIVLLQAR
jgi:Outer membrane protein beta-barrel domain